jgi:hypothetical protein
VATVVLASESGAGLATSHDATRAGKVEQDKSGAHAHLPAPDAPPYVPILSSATGVRTAEMEVVLVDAQAHTHPRPGSWVGLSVAGYRKRTSSGRIQCMCSQDTG